jgi:hypothetical protein
MSARLTGQDGNAGPRLLQFVCHWHRILSRSRHPAGASLGNVTILPCAHWLRIRRPSFPHLTPLRDHDLTVDGLGETIAVLKVAPGIRIAVGERRVRLWNWLCRSK